MAKRLTSATFCVPLGEGAILTCQVGTARVRSALVGMLGRLSAVGGQETAQAEVGIGEWYNLVAAGLVVGWEGFVGDEGKPLALTEANLQLLETADIAATIEAAITRSEYGSVGSALVEVQAADPTATAPTSSGSASPLTTRDESAQSTTAVAA